jgi:hypothetical protein
MKLPHCHWCGTQVQELFARFGSGPWASVSTGGTGCYTSPSKKHQVIQDTDEAERVTMEREAMAQTFIDNANGDGRGI